MMMYSDVLYHDFLYVVCNAGTTFNEWFFISESACMYDEFLKIIEDLNTCWECQCPFFHNIL